MIPGLRVSRRGLRSIQLLLWWDGHAYIILGNLSQGRDTAISLLLPRVEVAAIGWHVFSAVLLVWLQVRQQCRPADLASLNTHDKKQ